MLEIIRLSIIFSVIMLILISSAQTRRNKKSPCSGRYEIYESCGTACPETCKDGVNQNSDKTCALPCEAGCFCRKGYVRKSRRRKSPCVFAKQCSPIAKVSD